MRWFVAMVVASVVGMSATTAQIVERIVLAEDPAASLVCDINGTFACGNVLTAWQSTVFGSIPNAALGLTIFTIMLTFAAGGLLGVTFSRRAWGVAAFLTTFMAAFTIWFLLSTAFSVGQACLYCLTNGLAVLTLNIAMWRIGYAQGFLSGSGGFVGMARWAVAGGTDLVFWFGLAVVMGALIVLGLQT
jgi:uncharacterized membrane protein